MKVPVLLGLAAAMGVLSGCDSGPKSGKGFRLPEGDIAKGRATFVELGCNGCHTVAGVDLPPPLKPEQLSVVLGGKVLRIRSYGELVTAIINPSHELAKGYPSEKISREGKSLMTNFNEVMKVAQLIDLVTFLQSRYEKLEPDYRSDYPYY